jgi:hypothetical protein
MLSEIRNPKHEARNKSEYRMTGIRNFNNRLDLQGLERVSGILARFGVWAQSPSLSGRKDRSQRPHPFRTFEHSSFEFVSKFGFRFSDFVIECSQKNMKPLSGKTYHACLGRFRLWLVFCLTKQDEKILFEQPPDWLLLRNSREDSHGKTLRDGWGQRCS